MSYRCDVCGSVCFHSEHRVVTETREKEYRRTRRDAIGRVFPMPSSFGSEIVKEQRLCLTCLPQVETGALLGQSWATEERENRNKILANGEVQR